MAQLQIVQPAHTSVVIPSSFIAGPTETPKQRHYQSDSSSPCFIQLGHDHSHDKRLGCNNIIHDRKSIVHFWPICLTVGWQKHPNSISDSSRAQLGHREWLVASTIKHSSGVENKRPITFIVWIMLRWNPTTSKLPVPPIMKSNEPNQVHCRSGSR